MQLRILGSGQEIGRSGLEFMADKHIILDYGTQLQTEPPSWPLEPEKVDIVIPTHAHLDHSGGIPLLYRNAKPVLYTNPPTLDCTAVLIKDSMKVAANHGWEIPFSKDDFKKMMASHRFLRYQEVLDLGQTKITFYNSGHIPGSASVLINANGKRIFYTSDIKLSATRLLSGAILPPSADILIIESTYSQTEHPPREIEERKLIAQIEEGLAANEPVLIPVYAVGRAQELLLVLERYAKKISLDGMARRVSAIVASHPEYIHDPARLKRILGRITIIRNEAERRVALRRWPIILTTAAMMAGGPVLHYLRELRGRPEAKILFTGFLLEDSPAQILVETGMFKTVEEQFKVHCDIHKFDLSAHADRTELFEIIRRLKPQQVICVHGEECQKFAKDIESQLHIPAIAPVNGEIIKLNEL